MTNELLLDVKDLHAGYGRAEVLHGLDLKAQAGSVVTVIGRAKLLLVSFNSGTAALVSARMMTFTGPG